MDEAAWEQWYEDELAKQLERCLFVYRERAPLDVLPEEYHVTSTNTSPPMLHFGVPVERYVLTEFAEMNKSYFNPHFVPYFNPYSKSLTREGIAKVIKVLSIHINYPITKRMPYTATTDCDFILTLFSNYSMLNIERDAEREEKVIASLKETIGLDEWVQARWYFDASDPWKPKRGHRLKDFWWDEENKPHRYPSDSEDEDEDEGQDTE